MAEPLIFRLEGKEREAAAIWRATHPCNPDAMPSADHAHFSYIFTPGGLGVYVRVHCKLCGKSADMTDVENW